MGEPLPGCFGSYAATGVGVKCHKLFVFVLSNTPHRKQGLEEFSKTASALIFRKSIWEDGEVFQIVTTHALNEEICGR